MTFKCQRNLALTKIKTLHLTLSDQSQTLQNVVLGIYLTALLPLPILFVPVNFITVTLYLYKHFKT